MIAIRRVTPEDVSVFKQVRLRALKESPAAFSSTFERESQLPDDEWERRAWRWATDEKAAIFLAFDDDTACGIVGSLADGENPQRAHVISMWVDPAYRRTRVGKELLDAVLDWNGAREIREIILMVTSVNTGAIAFYEHIGFRKTGVTGPYPNDPAIIEYEMALSMS